MISILPTEHWLSREDGIPNWFSPAERNLPTSGRLNGQSFDFRATPEFPLSTASRPPAPTNRFVGYCLTYFNQVW